MARVTVSLSDALMAQLDEYASHHASSVSEVVQVALKVLFAEPPVPAPTPAPPPPAPPDTHPAERFQRLEDYVTKIAFEVEHIRQGLGAASCFLSHHGSVQLPCPQPISGPPWPYQPPPGWSHGHPPSPGGASLPQASEIYGEPGSSFWQDEKVASGPTEHAEKTANPYEIGIWPQEA